MQSTHSLWNYKDIFILQFSAIFLSYAARISRNLVVVETHLLADYFTIFFYFLFQVVFLALLLYWFLHLYDLSIEYFGLSIKKLFKSTVLYLKIIAPLIISVFGFLMLNSNLSPALDNYNPLINLQIHNLVSSLSTLLITTLFFIIPCLAYELLYRGFIGLYLQRFLGRIVGGFLSAFYFALFAGFNGEEWFIMHLLLGVLLFHLFRSQKSLWPSVIYHATFKAIMVLYFFGWGVVL